jgi:hypothetical protein
MKLRVYRAANGQPSPPVEHTHVAAIKIVGSVFVVEFTNGETTFWPVANVDHIETDHT